MDFSWREYAWIPSFTIASFTAAVADPFTVVWEGVVSAEAGGDVSAKDAQIATTPIVILFPLARETGRWLEPRAVSLPFMLIS